MVEKKSNWETYDYLLKKSKVFNKNRTIATAQSSFLDLIQDNPAYQETAKRNDEIQPMLVTRTSADKCSVQIKPEDQLFIGDLVECYGEHWLVKELFQDEYGLVSGTMWLCNYLCKFQDKDNNIVGLYGVIDDGKYSTTEKNIVTYDSSYNLYLPLTDDTKKFYIDKRLAVGTMFDKNGKEILQVMKIEWIDQQEVNLGAGSHLLKFKLTADVYNPEKDNIDELICDYINIEDTNEIKEETEENKGETTVNLTISGKDSIRIGTSRTYQIDGDIPNDASFEWSINEPSITLSPDGNQCKVSVPLDDNLLGNTIILLASDANLGVSVSKEVEVITIG